MFVELLSCLFVLLEVINAQNITDIEVNVDDVVVIKTRPESSLPFRVIVIVCTAMVVVTSSIVYFVITRPYLLRQPKTIVHDSIEGRFV